MKFGSSPITSTFHERVLMGGEPLGSRGYKFPITATAAKTWWNLPSIIHNIAAWLSIGRAPKIFDSPTWKIARQGPGVRERKSSPLVVVLPFLDARLPRGEYPRDQWSAAINIGIMRQIAATDRRGGSWSEGAERSLLMSVLSHYLILSLTLDHWLVLHDLILMAEDHSDRPGENVPKIHNSARFQVFFMLFFLVLVRTWFMNRPLT